MIKCSVPGLGQRGFAMPPQQKLEGGRIWLMPTGWPCQDLPVWDTGWEETDRPPLSVEVDSPGVLIELATWVPAELRDRLFSEGPPMSFCWRWKPYITAWRIGKALNYDCEVCDVVSWALRLKRCELSDTTWTTRSANGCQLANLLRKWDEKTEKLKESVGNQQGKNRNKTGIRLNRSLNAIARSDTEANPFVFAGELGFGGATGIFRMPLQGAASRYRDAVLQHRSVASERSIRLVRDRNAKPAFLSRTSLWVEWYNKDDPIGQWMRILLGTYKGKIGTRLGSGWTEVWMPLHDQTLKPIHLCSPESLDLVVPLEFSECRCRGQRPDTATRCCSTEAWPRNAASGWFGTGMPNRHSCPEPACELSDTTRTTRSANGCQLANLLGSGRMRKQRNWRILLGTYKGKIGTRLGSGWTEVWMPLHDQTLKPIHLCSPESLDLVVPLESFDRCEVWSTDGWTLTSLRPQPLRIDQIPRHRLDRIHRNFRTVSRNVHAVAWGKSLYFWSLQLWMKWDCERCPHQGESIGRSWTSFLGFLILKKNHKVFHLKPPFMLQNEYLYSSQGQFANVPGLMFFICK